MHLVENDLAKRGGVIQKLLRPITRTASGPAWSRIPLSPASLVLAMYDGARPSGQYRDWRFAVDARRHHGMYFEAWRRDGRGRYILEKAYLHVYERTQASEIEVIALHCDPDLKADAEHAKYKRGPHIHMTCASAP